jgi:Tol biopolymer transport system component
MKVSAMWVRADEGSGRARQIASEIGNYDRIGNYDSSEGMSWTPDGKILYRSIASGNWDIWSIDPDAGQARQLTVDPATDLHPSASPDGRYVVFASDRSGTFNIWRMERDGGNPIPLTRGTEEFFPQVSPDGRWLIYQRGLKAGEKATLWKVSIDGGEPQSLGDEYLARPAISPDGAWIASYYRKPGEPPRVALLPFTGGKPVNEFSGSPVPRIIRWIPDGRALTYIEDRDGVSNLWMQPLDGGPARPVTHFTTEQIFDFDWSRDGKRLAYSRGAVTNDIVMIRNFR